MLLYYVYSWISNYLSYSKTYMTSGMLHQSPLFYLSVFLCVGVALVVDLFVETIKQNLLGRPSSFVRKELGKDGTMPDEKYEHFLHLVNKKDQKYVQFDIAREKRLHARREKRMEQLQERLDSQKRRTM